MSDDVLFSSAGFGLYKNNFVWPTFSCDLSFFLHYIFVIPPCWKLQFVLVPPTEDENSECINP